MRWRCKNKGCWQQCEVPTISKIVCLTGAASAQTATNQVDSETTPRPMCSIILPYGVREAGWLSLSGCQPNRVQLS
jgi:hypothetical protein